MRLLATLAATDSAPGLSLAVSLVMQSPLASAIHHCAVLLPSVSPQRCTPIMLCLRRTVVGQWSISCAVAARAGSCVKQRDGHGVRAE